MINELRVCTIVFGIIFILIGTVLCIIPNVGTCYDENLNELNCLTENLEFFIPAIFLFLIGSFLASLGGLDIDLIEK